MLQNSKGCFNNRLLVANIKYWFLGNFISFSIGWTIILFILFWSKYDPATCKIDEAVPYYYFLFFGPFIGALSIKIIRKDIPWYIYSTTGLIFVIAYDYFIGYLIAFLHTKYSDAGVISNLLAIKQIINETFNFYNNHREYIVNNSGSDHFSKVIIVCLLSGNIVNIYRYFKFKYFKS
ncbi:MAG: hypothetical protein ABRQ39_02540 [Candidatus Eremiobacterota bacterium]